MDKQLESKLILESQGYEEYQIEEILEDYLPSVLKHIGFVDNRMDTRFIVKFHDICYFTNTPEDMSEETFDSLFNIFCTDQCMWIDEIINENNISEKDIFTTYDVGHYRAFEYIQEQPITTENALEVATNLYELGVSPSYMDEYTTLATALQNMEDTYMEMWIEFLNDQLECGDTIKPSTIKKIERRWKKYKAEHSK